MRYVYPSPRPLTCFLYLSDIHCLRYIRRFLSVVPLLSSDQRPEGFPVARSHGVVHEDVEGGVDVGDCPEDPQAGEEEVVVATTEVHLGQKEPGKAEQGDGRNAHDEQHRGADQHLALLLTLGIAVLSHGSQLRLGRFSLLLSVLSLSLIHI